MQTIVLVRNLPEISLQLYMQETDENLRKFFAKKQQTQILCLLF
jgi:hypothetical protein